MDRKESMTVLTKEIWRSCSRWERRRGGSPGVGESVREGGVEEESGEVVVGYVEWDSTDNGREAGREERTGAGATLEGGRGSEGEGEDPSSGGRARGKVSRRRVEKSKSKESAGKAGSKTV